MNNKNKEKNIKKEFYFQSKIKPRDINSLFPLSNNCHNKNNKILEFKKLTSEKTSSNISNKEKIKKVKLITKRKRINKRSFKGFKNNYNNNEDKNNEEIKQKIKLLERYKYHILHHNEILKEKNSFNNNTEIENKKSNYTLSPILKKENTEKSIYRNNSKLHEVEDKENSFESNEENDNEDENNNNTNSVINKSEMSSNYSRKKSIVRIKKLNNYIKKKYSISIDKKIPDDDDLSNKNKKFINKRDSVDLDYICLGPKNKAAKIDSLNPYIINPKLRRFSCFLVPSKNYLSLDEKKGNERCHKYNTINKTIKILPLTQTKSDINIFKKSNESKHFFKIKNNHATTNSIKSLSCNTRSKSIPILNNINKGNKKYYKHYVNYSMPLIYKNFNSLSQAYYSKYTVNFKKMLSRGYLDKIGNHPDQIISSVTPNFAAIEPKCIMKVTYKEKIYNFKKPSFKGLSADYTFDMNKIFFKYNNHISPKTINFEKVAGRIGKNSDEKSPLPSFMMGQYGRNIYNFMNEKNLKLNYFSNGRLKDLISSFNDKKSFNMKLNLDKLNIHNDIEKETKKEVENIHKKALSLSILNNREVYGKKLKNNSDINDANYAIKNSHKNFISEYQRFNNIFLGDKIDGITFKKIKLTNKGRHKYFNEYNKDIFKPGFYAGKNF